jgi:7-cyano-7-deazaguanine synthase
VPRDRDLDAADIPSTYVPARNTLFLALALGWAEVLDARDIVIGVNALDYSGYPDCRPAFIAAFEALASLATRAGVEGARFRVHTPLIAMT